jgi:hypothetical protein
MLAVLSPELRSELHNALIKLDSERISATILQVAVYDATLCEALSQLADNFDYPVIRKAVQTN